MKKMSKKKMMTGGMANSNSKVNLQTIPGSKGATPNVNPKAVVSPKMYGGSAKGKMMMKKGGKKMK